MHFTVFWRCAPQTGLASPGLVPLRDNRRLNISIWPHSGGARLRLASPAAFGWWKHLVSKISVLSRSDHTCGHFRWHLFPSILHSFGRWVGRWEIWCPRFIFPLRAALCAIFDIFKCHMTMLHSCRLLQIIVLGSTDTRVRHLRITFKLPCASLAPGIDYRKVLDI